jgi:hypothetical protein
LVILKIIQSINIAGITLNLAQQPNHFTAW